MAPVRRQSNGRSPLVNTQSQITSFFSKPTASSASAVPSPPPKETLETRRKANPNPGPSPGDSPSPTTPSPLQPKCKKPLLVIPSGVSRPAVTKSLGSEVVGKRARVYWPLDEAWYEGCVKAYDEESDRHVVVYDDGEEEALELAKEKVEWVEEGKKRLKRLRHGGGSRVGTKIVGVDDCVVKEDEEEDGDDEEDEDWGMGKVVEEDSDDDCDDAELVDDDEDSDIAVGRASGRSRSRKRKVLEVKAEDSGKKKKCGSIGSSEGKKEVLAPRPNINNGNKLKGV